MSGGWGSKAGLGSLALPPLQDTCRAPQETLPKPPPQQLPQPLLFIVAKLDGQAVSDAAKGGRLHRNLWNYVFLMQKPLFCSGPLLSVKKITT